ncbi:MAG: calcium-binding EGF-like domain-containing protein, partial [Myxococcales bacterium]
MHFRPIALLLATATLLACGSETPPPPGCDAGCSADGSVPFDPVTGCPTGFAPSADRTACVDVDECAAAGACAAGLNCVNEAGRFSCRCPEGFVGDEEGCSRLVDCAAEPTACHASASCVVTAQGRACVCDPGFVGDGTTCAATGYKLGLVKSSFDAYAGACVGPFELLKRDPDGYVDDFAGETLQLAGEGARFFANAACTTAI